MSGAYFNQQCPICGRGLKVRVAYLGRKVVCQHCDGTFQASDPESGEPLPMESGLGLLSRAQELIDSVNIQRAHSS